MSPTHVCVACRSTHHGNGPNICSCGQPQVCIGTRCVPLRRNDAGWTALERRVGDAYATGLWARFKRRLTRH